jgi:phosphatidylglycerol:prolipoprotein diacylglycerol transferase
MHPELFRIPFTQLTVKSYGLMLVVGFLLAVHVIRRLGRNITPDPQMITNASLYDLIAGVVGARVFYVIHYLDKYRGELVQFFAIWDGGLELFGGVFAAIVVIVLYMRYHKLPIRQYLDILAIGLMLALAIGRIGCFLSGCCFGKPSDLPWAVRFPTVTMRDNRLEYSLVYQNQVLPDLKRNRLEPELKLPANFFDSGILKPFDELSDEQKGIIMIGPYRCLPVHPTQLYSSANAAVLALILYLFWKRSQSARLSKNLKLFTIPGSTFSLMFILYSVTRFFIEILRDDNPFEYGWWAIYKGGTISQNISIYAFVAGIVLMLVFQKLSADEPVLKQR